MDVYVRGKIQLIDAASLKSPLRKNLGAKNCELSPEIREHILKLYLDFAETEHSKIFDNCSFGYWKVTVLRPLRLNFQASPERIARVSTGPEFMALLKGPQKKGEGDA
jgi:type I restriction enzyme M protein